MKAFKIGAPLLVAGSLLTGCSEWTGEIRFKVVRIHPAYESVGQTRPPYVVMEPDREQPEGLPPITTEGANIDQFPPDIEVGDVVLCHHRRWDDNGLDGIDPQDETGPCRRP
ncbi:hypothetical protein AB0A74_10980 [Saccharothrix sp. NPDC042600]|uniref:hypothetical protein n=1 Tax=Saccharothrix TaxID=2071 RepID=UPI003402BB17|nr:hypothetical protein GCM10017745_09460 [Saccharothrix mutabilis subsp. capreolus]